MKNRKMTKDEYKALRDLCGEGKLYEEDPFVYVSREGETPLAKAERELSELKRELAESERKLEMLARGLQRLENSFWGRTVQLIVNLLTWKLKRKERGSISLAAAIRLASKKKK